MPSQKFFASFFQKRRPFLGEVVVETIGPSRIFGVEIIAARAPYCLATLILADSYTATDNYDTNANVQRVLHYYNGIMSVFGAYPPKDTLHVALNEKGSSSFFQKRTAFLRHGSRAADARSALTGLDIFGYQFAQTKLEPSHDVAASVAGCACELLNSLMYAHGMFFGTSASGGAYGEGLVFSFDPVSKQVARHFTPLPVARMVTTPPAA